jgi:hypothetical protein
MLTVYPKGGLGNQLFQYAAAETIAKLTGRQFYLYTLETRKTDHSQEEYFNSILKNFKSLYSQPSEQYVNAYEDVQHLFIDWNAKLNAVDKNIILYGYFQNWKYISDSFCERLAFDQSVLRKFPIHKRAAFLHIRGGDYKNNWLHDVGLDSYYKKAIHSFPKGTHFYVFTNDIEYARSKSFLNNISYSFVFENEVDSLYLMSQCGLGGICANSSFSWWGSYLNRNRKILMPSKWFTDGTYADGYYFEGVTKVDI